VEGGRVFPASMCTTYLTSDSAISNLHFICHFLLIPKATSFDAISHACAHGVNYKMQLVKSKEFAVSLASSSIYIGQARFGVVYVEYP
jgi:hypothetical protein